MCKFRQLLLPPSCTSLETLHYIPQVEKCFNKYLKYLRDDFVLQNNFDCYGYISSLSPYFWVITNYNDEYMGFVYLDNFTGNENFLYSAELTTCFDRKAWGNFTRYSAKIFLKKCFDDYGLQKIKAQIYPDNFRIKNLLKSAGFEYEATLKNETLRRGKMQDIEVYGLYRDYYYKMR